MEMFTPSEAAQHVFSEITEQDFGSERIRLLVSKIKQGYILKEPYIVGHALIAAMCFPRGMGDARKALEERFGLNFSTQPDDHSAENDLINTLGEIVMERADLSKSASGK